MRATRIMGGWGVLGLLVVACGNGGEEQSTSDPPPDSGTPDAGGSDADVVDDDGGIGEPDADPPHVPPPCLPELNENVQPSLVYQSQRLVRALSVHESGVYLAEDSLGISLLDEGTQSATFVRETETTAYVTARGDWLYFSENDGIARVPIASPTDASQLIVTDRHDLWWFWLDDTYLYKRDSTNSLLERVALTGGDPTTLVEDVYVSSAQPVGEYVYYSDRDRGVFRVPVAGGAAEQITRGDRLGDLLVDGSTLYWSDGDGLHRTSLDDPSQDLVITLGARDPLFSVYAQFWDLTLLSDGRLCFWVSDSWGCTSTDGLECEYFYRSDGLGQISGDMLYTVTEDWPDRFVYRVPLTP